MKELGIRLLDAEPDGLQSDRTEAVDLTLQPGGVEIRGHVKDLSGGVVRGGRGVPAGEVIVVVIVPLWASISRSSVYVRAPAPPVTADVASLSTSGVKSESPYTMTKVSA